MFTIYVNDQAIYVPGDRELLVLNPKLTLEMGAAGSLEFSVPPEHPYYNSLKQLSTVVYTKRDNTEIFRGRVLSNTRDFYNFRQTYCEGGLSYLVDSVQKGEKYEGTAHGLFRKIIAAHNNLVDEPKRFVVGNITVPDKDIKIAGKTTDGDDPDEYSSDYWRQIYINSVADNWSTTLDYLNTCLIDYLGGYLMVRRSGSTNYIDWVKDYATTTSQVIEFGTNLIDLNEEITADDLFTVLIPIGDDNLTIASVNDGSIEISNPDLVAKYGRIVRTEVFGNVNQASTLLENAKNYLAKEASVPVSFTIKAVDLSMIESVIDAIKLGDRVKIKSVPHNIDQYYTCTKIEYDLENPENTVFTFGNPKQSLTQRYRKDKRVEQERSSYNSYSGGGALGGGLTNAATSIANETSKRETKSQLDDFFDAYIKVTPEQGAINLGAVYKKLVDGQTVLENNLGINFDAPQGTINIFADHDSISETKTELGNVKKSIKNHIGFDVDAPNGTIDLFADHESISNTINNLGTVKEIIKNHVGLDIDAPQGTINIFADHDSFSETKTNLETVKENIKNHIGFDVDAPNGTVNIFSDHNKVVETENEIGKVKTVLYQNAGINIDSPNGVASLYATADLAEEANGKAGDAQTKTAQIIAWAGVDPDTGELGTRIALEADLVTVQNRLQAVEGIFSNITTETAYASKGISSRTFYGGHYYISSSDDHETDLAAHYHNIYEDANTGGLILTGPIPLSARRPFDITDTAAYRNAVSGVDLSIVRGTNYSFDDTIISGTVAESADTVLSGNLLFACFTAVLDPSGKTKTFRVGINADKAFNSGGSGGGSGGESAAVASINAVRQTSDSNIYWNESAKMLYADYSLYAKDADSNNLYVERDYTITIPATKAFDAGAGSVDINAATAVAYNSSADYLIQYNYTPYYDNSYLYGTINIELTNGLTKTITLKIFGGQARNAGAQAVRIERIQRLPFAQSATRVNGTYSISADATNYNADSGILGTTIRIYTTASARYDALLNINASQVATALQNTIGIDTVSGGTYNAVADHSASISDASNTAYYNGMLYGTFNITLSNGAVKTLYVGINAKKAGGGSGGGTAAISSIAATQSTPNSLLVWNETDKTISGDFTLVAKDENGAVIGTEIEYPITIDASKAYNAINVTSVASSADHSPTSWSSIAYVGSSWGNNDVSVRCYIQVTLSNGKTQPFLLLVQAGQIYDFGANTLQVTGVTTAVTNTHLEEDGHHYVVTTLTPSARTKKIDNTYITATKEVTNQKITADAVYEAGFNAGAISGGGSASIALISSARETTDNNVFWNATNKTVSADFNLYARDSTNNILFTEREHTITIPATKAYNAGWDYGSNSLEITGVSTSISNSHFEQDGHHFIMTTIVPTARTSFSDGSYNTTSNAFTERRITADDVYEAGYKAGSAAGGGSTPSGQTIALITSARETTDANIYWDATNKTLAADYNLYAKDSDNNNLYVERSHTITIPATKAYNAGWDYGARTVKGNGCSSSITNTHLEKDGHHYVVVELKPQARTTLSNGGYVTLTTTISGHKITADDVYAAGAASASFALASVSTVRESSDSDIQWTDSTKSVSAEFTVYVRDSNDFIRFTKHDHVISIPATKAYNAGWDYGATTISITGAATSITNTHLEEDGHHYIVVTIYPTARAQRSDGSYYTISTNFNSRKITADSIYNIGYAHGQQAITSITSSRNTTDENIYWNATNKSISADFNLYAKSNDSNVFIEREHTITIPATKAYNAGWTYGLSTVAISGAATAVTNTHLVENSHHYVVISINPSVNSRNPDGSFNTLRRELTSYKVTADNVYNKGYLDGQQSISAVTSSRETADKNVYWNATDKTVSADYNLYVKANGNNIYVEREHTITIPATKAYDAGYSAGQAAGSSSAVDHVNLSVSYNSSTHKYSVVATVYGPNNTVITSRSTASDTTAYDRGYDAGYSYASSAAIGVSSVGYETDDTGATDWNHIWVKLSNGATKGNIRLSPNGYTTGYQAGYKAASSGSSSYQEGYNAGYSAGHSAGYSKGYRQGIKDMNRVTSITVTATNSNSAGIRAYHSNGGYGFRWVSIGDYWNGY